MQIYHSPLKQLRRHGSLMISQLFFWTYLQVQDLLLDSLLASPLARMSWNTSVDFVFQGQDLPCSFMQEGQRKLERFKLRSVVHSK